MNKPNFIRTTDQWRASLSGLQHVLVLALSPGQLSAAVYRASRKSSGTIGPMVQSRAYEFDQALGDVLEQLTTLENEPLPRHARLAAQMVLPGIIELPVNPAKPRKAREMRTLVLAEMETAYVESNSTWTIGMILAAHGVLAAEQQEAILLEQHLRRSTSGGRGSLFGELAIEMGYAKQTDISAALRYQETLQTLDLELAASWHAAKKDSRNPPEPGMYRYHVCVAAEKHLDNWRSSCRRQKLSLGKIWPLAWCALEDALSDETWQAPFPITDPANQEGIHQHALARLGQGGKTLSALPNLSGKAAIDFSATRLKPYARYLLPVLALNGVFALDAYERNRLTKIAQVFDQNEKKSKEAALLASHNKQAQTEILGKQQAFDQVSTEYERMLNENINLANIAAMRHNLPDLIRALARSAQSPVVIDKIANNSNNSEASRIQVIAWSPDYGAVQRFATQAQDEVARLGFNIALSEIGAHEGRQAEPGYRISFWLAPADGELDDATQANETKSQANEAGQTLVSQNRLRGAPQ